MVGKDLRRRARPIPGLTERIAQLRAQEAVLRASSASRVESRKAFPQNWVRQKLIAVPCVGEGRYLTAYLEQGTPNIAKDVTKLRNRAAALGIHITFCTKRAQLYQLCMDDGDINAPLPHTTRRALTVHLFGNSTTILPRKSGANRVIGDVMAGLLKRSGAGQELHFVDHTIGGAAGQDILEQLGDATRTLPRVDEEYPILQK